SASSMSSHGSMDFRVELSDQAQRDIAAIYNWLRSQQAGDAGERWFVALRAAIASLENIPSRCPLAPENRASSHFPAVLPALELPTRGAASPRSRHSVAT